MVGGRAAVVEGAVYASTGGDPVPDRERVPTATERGALAGVRPGREGRSCPPGPDPRYRVAGVARLPAGTVTDPAHTFGPSAPHGAPDTLRERGR